MKIKRPWKRIDVLAIVNDEIVVAIEDKTDTANHSRQLDRYLVHLRKQFQPPRWAIAPIYLKTGDQCSYDEVRKAGWSGFLRPDFLGVFGAVTRLGQHRQLHRLPASPPTHRGRRPFRPEPLPSPSQHC